jgi:hypothetical protein
VKNDNKTEAFSNCGKSLLFFSFIEDNKNSRKLPALTADSFPGVRFALCVE